MEIGNGIIGPESEETRREAAPGRFRCLPCGGKSGWVPGMIVTTAQLYKVAYGKFAIGAYNVNNLEQILGLFQGCIASKAPFIIGAGYSPEPISFRLFAWHDGANWQVVPGGLGVPLATLFDDLRAAANPVSHRDDRTTWRDPQSGYVRRNISPANFPSPLQIVEVVLPAGASVAFETGSRDVSIHQQIWVQQGSIEVTLGNTIHRLAQDDCLAMQLNQPMNFRNRTRNSARYIVIIASARARALGR